MYTKPLVIMETEKEDWRIYYKIQYERINYLEQQRLTFSNIVVVVTALFVTFGFSVQESYLLWSKIVITSIFIVAINISAILFINKSRYWIKLHQERARKIREVMFNGLNEIMEEIPKTDSNLDPLRRAEVQKLIHKIFIILSFVYPLLLLLEIKT